MTTPVWMLLGFAIWTILSLVLTVGVIRWSQVLAGKKPIKAFRADKKQGSELYCRAMRAHANCVENLPIFAVVVFALYVSQIRGELIDHITIGILLARVIHTLIHILFVQTNLVAGLRFFFYFLQIVGFIWLTMLIITYAW